MTKCAAIEGTSIIANDYSDKLINFVLPEMIDEAKSLSSMISVVKEGIIAADFGATAMHDATEGGILGAVWEVAECSNVGVEIFADDIPVIECTKIISKLAGIDYLRLISSGSMIITSYDGENLVKLLKSNNIEAALIGKITNSGKFVTFNGERKELLPQEKDEIYNVFLKD